MPRIELNAEPGSKLCPLRWVRINFTFLSPRLASRFPSLLRCGDIMAHFWAALGKWAGVGSGARNPENERSFWVIKCRERERDEDGKRGGGVPISRSPIKADAGNESETVLLLRRLRGGSLLHERLVLSV